MRKLSKCSELELGIAQIVGAKVWAYVPVIPSGPGGPSIGLGIAYANEPGYIAIPPFHAWADTYDEMADHADELNAARGLDPAAAAKIVASSMAAGKVSA